MLYISKLKNCVFQKKGGKNNWIRRKADFSSFFFKNFRRINLFSISLLLKRLIFVLVFSWYFFKSKLTILCKIRTLVLWTRNHLSVISYCTYHPIEYNENTNDYSILFFYLFVELCMNKRDIIFIFQISNVSHLPNNLKIDNNKIEYSSNTILKGNP